MTFKSNATNRCRKRPVVAILVTTEGEVFVGENRVTFPQDRCPRLEQGYVDGEGWHLCKEICGQPAHAEVDALQQAGEKARGGHLYLVGHWRACADCAQKLADMDVTLEVCVEHFDLSVIDSLLKGLPHPTI